MCLILRITPGSLPFSSLNSLGKLAALVVVPVEFLQHGHDFVAEEAAVIEKVPNDKDGDQDAANAQQSSGEHV